MATQASQIDGAKAAESLLLRFPQITAAVCYQDIVALGVMQALRKMGREPGAILRWWGSTTSPKRRWYSLRSPLCRWLQRDWSQGWGAALVAFREMTNHRNVLFCRLRWWSENHVVLADRHAFY